MRPAIRVYVESGTWLEAMVPQLKALGMPMSGCFRRAFKANAIEWLDGRWVGAADPRSEGIAVSE